MKVEIKWFSVKDKLPVIPKGKCGISVLANIYDSCYEECCPGHGSHVSEIYYGVTRDRNGRQLSYYEGTDLEEDFMDLYIGNSYENTSYGPIHDEVTHWAYMPEPIKIDKD